MLHSSYTSQSWDKSLVSTWDDPSSLSLSVAPSTPRPTPETSHSSSSCQADESVAWECPTGTCQSYHSAHEAVSAAKLFGMSGLGRSEERCGLNTSFLPSKDVFLSDAQRAIGKNLGLPAEENKPLSIGRNDCGFNMGLRWKREEGSGRLLLLHAHLSLGVVTAGTGLPALLWTPTPSMLHSAVSALSPALIWSRPVPLKTSHCLPIEASLDTRGPLPSISPYAPYPLTPGL